MLQPSKIIKRMMTDREAFLNLKQFLCDRGDAFEYESSGSQDTIIHKNVHHTYFDLADAKGKGFHLSRIFKRDVDQWISDHPGELKPHDGNFKEQLFNVNAIEKVVGKASVAIDISECYWKTSYMQGWITEKTYIIGKRKKEWKTGRNACIGGLCKKQYSVPYRKGKPNYKKRKLKPIRPEYITIRNHIIGSIYNMFMGLHKLLGDDFYIYMTDCVFTSFNRLKEVQDYFASYGYECSIKPIDFLSLDKERQRIVWFDYKAEKKDKEGNVIETGFNKYYDYAQHQVISTPTTLTVVK